VYLAPSECEQRLIAVCSSVYDFLPVYLLPSSFLPSWLCYVMLGMEEEKKKVQKDVLKTVPCFILIAISVWLYAKVVEMWNTFSSPAQDDGYRFSLRMECRYYVLALASYKWGRRGYLYERKKGVTVRPRYVLLFPNIEFAK